MTSTDTAAKPCYTCEHCGSVASYLTACCGLVMVVMKPGGAQ
jgi:hypothetical protein